MLRLGVVTAALLMTTAFAHADDQARQRKVTLTPPSTVGFDPQSHSANLIFIGSSCPNVFAQYAIDVRDVRGPAEAIDKAIASAEYRKIKESLEEDAKYCKH